MKTFSNPYQWSVRSSLLLATVTALALYVVGCAKPADSTNDPKADPTNPNALQSILVIPGATVVNQSTLPTSSAASTAPVVSNNDESVSYSAGSQIILPIDVSAKTSSPVAGVYVQVNGASTYLNVPIPGGQTSGTFAVPITIPANVASGTFQITYKFYDASGNVSASKTVVIAITPGELCDRTKVSGGQGVTSTLHSLKDKPGVVNIKYNTYVVPDKIDVFQNGVWIGGTGPATSRSSIRKALNCSQATASAGYIGAKGEFNFIYDPTKGTSVEVVVSGCENGGTIWEYTIACPADVPVFDFTLNGKKLNLVKATYAYVPGSEGWAVGLTGSSVRLDPNKFELVGSGDIVVLGFYKGLHPSLGQNNQLLGDGVSLTSKTGDSSYDLLIGENCTNDDCANYVTIGQGYDSGSFTIKRSGSVYEISVNVVFSYSNTNEKDVVHGVYRGR